MRRLRTWLRAWLFKEETDKLQELLGVMDLIKRVQEQQFAQTTKLLVAAEVLTLAGQGSILRLDRVLVNDMPEIRLGAHEAAKNSGAAAEGVERLLLLLEPQAKKLTARRPVAPDWDAVQLENLGQFEEKSDVVQK